MAKMKWWGAERYEDIKKEQERRMQQCVRLVRNEVIKSISNKYPPASEENNPPALRTGQLRRSIATEVVEEGGEIRGRVGSNLEYAKYLEMPEHRNRPFLVPAVDRARGAIKAILSKKM